MKCLIGENVSYIKRTKVLFPRDFRLEDLVKLSGSAKDVGIWLRKYPKIQKSVRRQLISRTEAQNGRISARNFSLYAHALRCLFYAAEDKMSPLNLGNVANFEDLSDLVDYLLHMEDEVGVDFLLQQDPNIITAYFEQLTIPGRVAFVRRALGNNRFHEGALNDVIVGNPACVLEAIVTPIRDDESGSSRAFAAPRGLLTQAMYQRSPKYVALAVGSRVAYEWKLLGFHDNRNVVFDRIEHRREFDPLKNLAYTTYDPERGAAVHRELYRLGFCDFQQAYYASRPHHAETARLALAWASNLGTREEVFRTRRDILADIIRIEHARFFAQKRPKSWPYDVTACMVVTRSLTDAGFDCAKSVLDFFLTEKRYQPEYFGGTSGAFLEFLSQEVLPNFSRLRTLLAETPRDKYHNIVAHKELIEWYETWNPSFTDAWQKK